MKKPAIVPQSLVYDTELETGKVDYICRVHLLYDRGKYREEIIYPGSRLSKARYMQIYDNTKPHIAWGYNINVRRAFVLPESSGQALSREARRDGVTAVRQRYGLPARFPIFILADDTQPLQCGSALVSKDSLEGDLRPVGLEMVAGYKCQIYEGRRAQMTETSRDGVPGSRMASGTQDTRAWVEPRTGLVLRLEQRTTAGAGSPMPPRANGYVVKSLHFPAAIPPEMFRLPPGTTASTARIFKGLKLPPGVMGIPGKGKAAEIGIDIQ